MPALILLLISAGCASDATSLTFQSTQSNLEYSQKFSRAYFCRAESGEYEVVLIDDGLVPAKGKPGAPIVAAASEPLNQMVYIRILWRPLRGSKPDTPSATNAIIDWYVRTNDASGASDRLHYRGAGFVAVYDFKNGTNFVVRSGRMDLSDASGRLHDPLGPSSVSGSFVAQWNDGQVAAVRQVIRDMESSRKNPIPSSSSAHDGPPPRAPTGP